MGEFEARPASSVRWRFGVFEFNEQTLELTKNGRSVSVRPQPLRVLALLLAHPGDVVSREGFHQALWGDDTFVDFEQGLNHAIRELRAALGDAADSPRYIQTLPKRGYRFIPPVEHVGAPNAVGQSRSELKTEPPAAEAMVVSMPSGQSALGRQSGWLWGSLIGVVAVGIGIAAAYFGLRPGLPATLEAPTTLIIRRFTSPADPALGIGIANAISARLGGQQAMSVRSHAAPDGANGMAADNAGARPRGAAHALDGEISINGQQVDALVRLEDAGGTIVWSDRIHVRADELFSLEDVIAERVVAALRLRLASNEQARLRRRYTSNSSAYADYVRGRAALVTYRPESTLAAIAAFEHALQLDPAYALARAGLAMASADMYLRFSPPEDVEQWGKRAEAEARAALALDPDLAEAHLARAAVARKREFDWNSTLAESRRALALNPNLDQARFFVAAAYYHNGYMEEALIEMEKGRSLHGTDVIEPVRIDALVALFSGNFAPARVRLEEVSRLSSQAIGDTYLALAYYYSGSTDRGRAMLDSLAASRSASTAARASAALAGVLAAQRQPAAARRQLNGVLTRAYRDHHVAYSLGVAYAQLGEPDAADRWLRTAADTGFPCLPFFERDPLLEPLRSRAGFTDLLGYVRARREASLSAASQ